MGRQLFLHHYLPAHLASALVAGALIEFIFNLEPADVASLSKEDGKTITKGPRNKPIRERIAGQSLLATWAASGVVVAALIWGFLFFAPLTYGTPGLDVPQVQSRKWLNYDLHFAK
jgi:dolichyl-phosphate-mannose-protein mannosyltransferase